MTDLSADALRAHPALVETLATGLGHRHWCAAEYNGGLFADDLPCACDLMQRVEALATQLAAVLQDLLEAAVDEALAPAPIDLSAVRTYDPHPAAVRHGERWLTAALEASIGDMSRVAGEAIERQIARMSVETNTPTTKGNTP